jgi:hypothetical protein
MNMKFIPQTFRNKLAICTLLFSLTLLSGAMAQSKWQYAAAIAHGNKAEAFGLHLRPTYKLFEKVHVAPSLTIYGESNPSGLVSQRVTEYNADAFYLVDSKDSLFEPYFLAGLNFSRQRMEFDLLQGVSKMTKSGVNIGAGVNLRLLKRFAPFAEARFTLGGYGQFEIMAGLKI